MTIDRHNDPFKKRLLLLSPVVVIAVGHLTAQVAGRWLGVWAWAPLELVYWTMLALLIMWGGGVAAIRRWLGKPKGGWGWSLLSVVIGFIPVWLLLQNWQLLASLWGWLPWLLVALINPWLEEGYWRGLLLDLTKSWAAWASVLYTSLLFALSHPLMWGVHSLANRDPAVVVSTLLMGVCWAVTYRRTGSLRWVIFAHMLVDLFNISVATFLNLYIPPTMSR